MAMPPNLHSVYMAGMYPLGVECRGCHRKALVPADRFGGCKGDMTELRHLRLACTACGSRDLNATVFLATGHAEAWLEGLTVSPVDGSLDRCLSMADLASPRPMATFNPYQPALVRDPTNETVWDWPAGVTPAQWQQGATWHELAGARVVNWHGLLLEGWQPIDDTTPRWPLPDDCLP